MKLKLSERWREIGVIDLRSLALFRVCVGLVLLITLCLRFADLSAFYTDAGVMPRAGLLLMEGPWRLSLHLANGGAWFQALLLFAAVLAAFAFLIGYRTRPATIISWALLVSLHNRNPVVLTGGDDLLVCLLFWSLFLPLGARYSVDAALSTRPPPQDHRHVSFASAALLLQVMSVYFFGAVTKDSALLGDASTLPAILQNVGPHLRFLQIIGPLLVFLPLANTVLRFGVMVLLMLMHIGQILCLELGSLPYVGLASLTVLLGGWAWNRLARGTENTGIKIYYDRDCGFCLRACLLLREFLILPRAEILPAQEHQRTNALMQAHGSWIVIDRDDRAHLKWPAWVALLRHSPLFGGLGRLLSLPFLIRPGNAAYDFVGRRRFSLGRLAAGLPAPRAERFEAGRAAQNVAAGVAVLVLAWNLATIGAMPARTVQALSPPLQLLRLDQDWAQPAADHGWFVVPGLLADGGEVDLLHPEHTGVSYDMPREEKNSRWQSYHRHIYGSRPSHHRLYYSRYLCRAWNAGIAPDKPLVSLKIVFMLERGLLHDRTPAIEQRVLWRHDCADTEEDVGSD